MNSLWQPVAVAVAVDPGQMLVRQVDEGGGGDTEVKLCMHLLHALHHKLLRQLHRARMIGFIPLHHAVHAEHSCLHKNIAFQLGFYPG